MWPLTPGASKRPPWLLRLRSSTAFIVATVWISSFTDYFLYAMIVPVLPTALSDRAGVPYEDREYWVSVLLMSEAAIAFICCPLFGYIIDIAPTRQVSYLLGLILLGASMVLLSVAHTAGLFVAARMIQGGATAMVAVAGLALLTDSIAFDNLGQSIGYLGSAIALGFLLGPLLGGLVYEAAGYQAVFAMSFVLVGVDLIMRVAVIEKKVARRWVVLEDDGVVNGNGNGIDASHRGNANGYEYGTLPAGAEVETSSTKPALLLLARQPRVIISSWALLVQGLLYSAFDSTIPIFVETHFNWGPLGAGMTFLPSALTAFFEPYFGRLSTKYGIRKITFTGFLLLTAPLISLGFITPTHTQTETHTHTQTAQILLLTLLALTGLLINLTIPALYVETQQVLEEMERAQPGLFGEKGAVAQAFGIQTMAQFLGMFIGPLWGGFMADRFGWRVMAVSLGGLAGGTALPMLWLSGRSRTPAPSSATRLGDGHEDRDREREGEPLLGGRTG